MTAATRNPAPPPRLWSPRPAALCVAVMVGAAYAAVPLYNWFCRVTGFNGTTQVATSAPAGVLDRKMTVRFDANVGPGLPWRFEPEQNSIEVRLGEVVTVNYRVINETARADHGVGGLQRHAAQRRRLLPEDQLLLLHRADAQGRREARHAGGVLRRSGDGEGRRRRRGQRDHAVLHLLSAARAVAAGGGQRAGPRGRARKSD